MQDIRALFSGKPLRRRLAAVNHDLRAAVDSLSDDQILTSTDRLLAEYLARPLAIDRIDLKVGDARLVHPSHSSPGSQNARPLVRIPLSGDVWLFECRPRHCNSTFPTGRLVETPHSSWTAELYIIGDHQHFGAPKTVIETPSLMLTEIQFYVDRINTEVDEYNETLTNRLHALISRRRATLGNPPPLAVMSDPDAIAQDLDLPRLTINATSRPIGRSIAHSLFPDETYEDILDSIRQTIRSFETAPSSYSALLEEQLRDLILANLNSRWRGAAVGEAFRNRGKTDVMIEISSRAAFVAELKIWKGRRAFSNTLSQLFRYLTWRDTKVAIVLFNKEHKNFGEIIDIVRTMLQSSPLFLAFESDQLPNECRVTLKDERDLKRLTVVHILTADLRLT